MENMSIEFYEESYSLINTKFKKEFPMITILTITTLISDKLKEGFAPTRINKITKNGLKIRFTNVNSKKFNKEKVGATIEKFILDAFPEYREIDQEKKFKMYAEESKRFKEKLNNKIDAIAEEIN